MKRPMAVLLIATFLVGWVTRELVASARGTEDPSQDEMRHTAKQLDLMTVNMLHNKLGALCNHALIAVAYAGPLGKTLTRRDVYALSTRP
jgi:hypothetical protein